MWSPREQHAVVVYGSTMYLTGGYASALYSFKSNCGAYACGDTDASSTRYFLNVGFSFLLRFRANKKRVGCVEKYWWSGLVNSDCQCTISWARRSCNASHVLQVEAVAVDLRRQRWRQYRQKRRDFLRGYLVCTSQASAVWGLFVFGLGYRRWKAIQLIGFHSTHTELA